MEPRNILFFIHWYSFFVRLWTFQPLPFSLERKKKVGEQKIGKEEGTEKKEIKTLKRYFVCFI
jgi:hypothetical protein